MKIRKIEKSGRYLKVYVKRPFGKNLRGVIKSIEIKYNDKENYNFLEPNISIDKREIVLTFVLRSKEDILPYIKNENGEI